MSQKVKVFCRKDVSELEDEINNYLAQNPKLKVLNIFATETVIHGESWSTVYLLVA